MEPVVLAFASNDSYFQGLYCAVASALCYLDPDREVDVKVLDGGLSQSSLDTLSALVQRFRKRARLEFVTADASIFDNAALGPGQSHMAYCRLLLPQLLDVPRLIYLDCDLLVLRDLSQLYDLQLSGGKTIAAVPDSETSCLAEDSLVVARAIQIPPEGIYFNSGVMLMNLNALRQEKFFQRAADFLNVWNGKYRFHDQSAINFLLHERIQPLTREWNWPAWRFDAQENNELNCVLHYTTSTPWRGGARTPSQVLFERFAEDAALPVNRHSSHFKRSARRNSWRNVFAPLRAIVFPICSLVYGIAGKKEKSAAYRKVARYWLGYIRKMPARWRLYRRRTREIVKMKFDVRTSPVVS